MPCVERQVLELMRLVHKDMVDVHLPEVHHIVRPRLYRVFPLLGSPYKYRVSHNMQFYLLNLLLSIQNVFRNGCCCKFENYWTTERSRRLPSECLVQIFRIHRLDNSDVNRELPPLRNKECKSSNCKIFTLYCIPNAKLGQYELTLKPKVSY